MPREIAAELAAAKARSIASGDWVIGSDSVVERRRPAVRQAARPRRGRRASALLLRQDDAADQRGGACSRRHASTGSHAETARLDVRRAVRRIHQRLSRCRMARGRLYRRRVPAGGARRAVVRPHRGRPFHDPRDAADPAARRASRARIAGRHDPDRADRLDRHGQVDRRRMFERAGVPVFDADAVVRALQGPGGALVETIGAAFPGHASATGTLDRECLAGDRARRPRRARGARSASSIRRSTRAREAFIAEHRDAPALCSRFPCCSRPAAKASSTRSWSCPPRPRFSAQRCSSATGMTAAKLELDPRAPDARCGEARDAPISSIDTGTDLSTTESQVRDILACLGLAGR